MKTLEVMTEHTTPFKILIEVLKDMLPEVNIEFRYEVDEKKTKKKNKKNNKNKKNKNKSKKKSNNTSSAEDTEDTDELDKLLDESEEDGDSDNDEKSDSVKSKKNKMNDKNGMRIMAVDTTKTVLINLKLDAKNFTKFKCKKKTMELGVNLGYFHKFIKSMDKDDNLTLYTEHDDKNYLKIRIDNPEEKKESIYKLKLLDLNNDPMSIPDTTFDAVVTMNSSEFHKLCREMNQIADFVDIRCLENKIIFSCKGDIGDRTTTYKIDDDDDGDGISIEHAQNNPLIVQGIYELKNLVLFSKCASLCNDIEIYMKNDYPLVIKYTVATLGRVLLCLTPINDDNADYSDEDDNYSDDDVELL
jgi:proliferating cell nuclear antigen PCNA